MELRRKAKSLKQSDFSAARSHLRICQVLFRLPRVLEFTCFLKITAFLCVSLFLDYQVRICVFFLCVCVFFLSYLVHACSCTAQDWGYDEVLLLVEENNQRAKKLYQKLGYKVSCLLFCCRYLLMLLVDTRLFCCLVLLLLKDVAFIVFCCLVG